MGKHCRLSLFYALTIPNAYYYIVQLLFAHTPTENIRFIQKTTNIYEPIQRSGWDTSIVSASCMLRAHTHTTEIQCRRDFYCICQMPIMTFNSSATKKKKGFCELTICSVRYLFLRQLKLRFLRTLSIPLSQWFYCFGWEWHIWIYHAYRRQYFDWERCKHIDFPIYRCCQVPLDFYWKLLNFHRRSTK